MNKKQATTPNGGIIYTVQGEYFPKSVPALHSPAWTRGDEDPLSTEMRLFGACLRWAFNRLLEGKTRAELKKEGQDLFGLNSRYVDDAILKAKEVLNSQKELLVQEIEATDKKLDRAKKKLRQQVCKGRATREEWRNARQNRLYARGDETKGGNPNIKINYQTQRLSLYQDT